MCHRSLQLGFTWAVAGPRAPSTGTLQHRRSFLPRKLSIFRRSFYMGHPFCSRYQLGRWMLGEEGDWVWESCSKDMPAGRLVPSSNHGLSRSAAQAPVILWKGRETSLTFSYFPELYSRKWPNVSSKNNLFNLIWESSVAQTTGCQPPRVNKTWS